jgi:uncharacterized heparinase superfamily protein
MQRTLGLLLRTVRYLKPVQFYWRIYLRLNRWRAFDMRVPVPLTVRDWPMIAAAAKWPSYRDGSLVFLNQAADASLPIAWNDAQQSKLWLYNLHYFDYLQQPQIVQADAEALMQDWIAANQPGCGNGWEPYPISLRVVNWIKFLHGRDLQLALGDTVRASLYLQLRYLFRHLEYHLLGNHLFKNAVALIYGGLYFDSDEAARWLHKGLAILRAQLDEQVLADGGHFERSPMYHALILEDVLDCLNALSQYPQAVAADLALLSDKAAQMLQFMADTLHPDGEIGFFNDCAIGIAPAPQRLFDYARRLGLDGPQQQPADGLSLIEKPQFGLYVLQNARSRMLFDAGCIGPDYLPGHAHCDTLSYELSIDGRRCIVNSGTYQYAGSERNRFRATAAHNTVQVDGQEQHEIWSTFRVARRGYPSAVSADVTAQGLLLSAAHNGYSRLPGSPLHKREVRADTDSWIIVDTVTGADAHAMKSFVHLHPDVAVLEQAVEHVVLSIADRQFVIQMMDQLEWELISGVFAAEFGMKQANKTLVLSKTGICPLRIAYKIALHG